MRTLLFCQNPYAFGILGPLADVLIAKGHEILWYAPTEIKDKFPYKASFSINSSISDCYHFSPDAIFVPGNEVPHYLSGVKVQIFHGFAGEKKGHFRIRHYFDLYLTQGPWFTSKFKELAFRYNNFEVAETGWSKLDPLFIIKGDPDSLRSEILKNNNSEKLILYAPTFSPSLTSADESLESIINLSKKESLHIIVKFHDLTEKSIIHKYEKAAEENNNLEISTEKNILPLLQSADLMISDTSSAVYEFLLLDKPVITINSKSSHISWDNISDLKKLEISVLNNLSNDPFSDSRLWFVENYHPYSDGKSSFRMIKEVEAFIKRNGTPDQRKLPFLRKLKMNKMFGKEKEHV